jgi:hypothetical protein
MGERKKDGVRARLRACSGGCKPRQRKGELGKQDWLIRVHLEKKKITGREGKYIYI